LGGAIRIRRPPVRIIDGKKTKNRPWKSDRAGIGAQDDRSAEGSSTRLWPRSMFRWEVFFFFMAFSNQAVFGSSRWSKNSSEFHPGD